MDGTQQQAAMSEQNKADALAFVKSLLPVNDGAAGMILERVDGWEDLDDETLQERLQEVWKGDGIAEFWEIPLVEASLDAKMLYLKQSQLAAEVPVPEMLSDDRCPEFPESSRNVFVYAAVRSILEYVITFERFGVLANIAVATGLKLYNVTWKEGDDTHTATLFAPNEAVAVAMFAKMVSLGVVQGELVSVELHENPAEWLTEYGIDCPAAMRSDAETGEKAVNPQESPVGASS